MPLKTRQFQITGFITTVVLAVMKAVVRGHLLPMSRSMRRGKTITGVTISSSDTSALGGDGTEALTLNGNAYSSNQNAICVALGTDVTYTITATFSDTSAASQDRNAQSPAHSGKPAVRYWWMAPLSTDQTRQPVRLSSQLPVRSINGPRLIKC